MNFFEAIKICFKKYATFSGRAPRSEFWYFVLFYIICSFIAPIMDYFLFGTMFGMFYWVFYILTLLPYLAVWISNRPGTVKIVWQEYLVETNVIGLLFVFSFSSSIIFLENNSCILEIHKSLENQQHLTNL